MLEALAAAIATAILSLGSGAALSAAKKAGETRDSVLLLSGRVGNLEALLQQYLVDTRSLEIKIGSINIHLAQIEGRLEAVENGIVDRRSHNEQ